MTAAPPRIGLFCPSLGLGGSEQQLVNLAIGLHARGYDVRAIVLYGGESLEQRLSQSGVPVVCLNKKTAFGAIGAAFKLLRYVCLERISILYSFHGLPNLMALLTRPLIKRIRVVIGVRSTAMDISRRKWWQRWAYRLEPYLATRADLVIANSHAGRRDAVERGFPSAKLRVVLNGIDVNQFGPDSAAGLRARRELHIDPSVRIVGLVARIDPMKDHRTFLEAAASVNARQQAIRFICVWDGDSTEQLRLVEFASRLGLSDAVLWTRGDREMRALYNAMDIAVSSSCYGEGFSNAIAEAMACGCRCVVTDVGDSASLVEGLGIVVPPGDPSKLADGILTALAAIRRDEHSVATRERVLLSYSVDAMVNGTLECLLPLTLPPRDRSTS